jgi:hypothetical protein
MDNNNPSYFNPNVLNNISPFNYEPTIVEVDSIGIGISENTLSNLNLTPTQNLIVAEQSIYNLNTGNCNYTYGLQVDKTGIVHAGIGKVSFESDKIVDHAHEISQTLLKLKPTAAKGTYIKSIHLSSTMSPAIALDPKAV